MWLSDTYDVPQAFVDDPRSPAFRQYLLNWFGSNHVSFSERLRTANNLTPEETEVARQLIRRNLKCGYSHIVSGTWALDDLQAVPLLRVMFDAEPDESRRLVIAGALWKLNRVRDHNQPKGAGPWALGLLNHLETGHLVPKDEQRPPSYYRERRNDPAFREMMLQSIHKSIAQMHQGH